MNPRTQRGAALFVVMIMVLIIGLTTAFGLRAALFTSRVASSARTSALAMEAAEAALRYCEVQALSSAPAVPILDPSEDGTQIWRERATWKRPGNSSVPVPAAWLNTTEFPQKYGQLPECVVERLLLLTMPGTEPTEAYLVTARGFSPDAELNMDGTLRAGSEVWLQSTIRR